MASSFLLLRILILLSLSLSSFSLYTPFLPSTPPLFINPSQTLISSHHLSMSLTLQLISQSLLPNSNSLTIFAPPDSDFVRFGQPSLSLLCAHISPRRFSVDEIKALPEGFRVPTLELEEGLIVTSSFLDGDLMINDVGVDDFAIFDDGLVVIYGIRNFFNLSGSRNWTMNPVGAPISSGFDPISNGYLGINPMPVGSVPKPSEHDTNSSGTSGSDQNPSGSSWFDPISNGSSGIDPMPVGSVPKPSELDTNSSGTSGSDQTPSGSSGFDPISNGFGSIDSPAMEALRSLRSRGYAKMATFLDMQLGLQGWPMQFMKLTIFAPTDEAIDESAVSFGNYSTLFRAHAVPGLLRWLDLVLISDGTRLQTFSEDGFRINVDKSGDLVVVNGVPVAFPDMFCSDWLVVHGLNKAVWPVEVREVKLSVKLSSIGSDYNLDFQDYDGDLDEESSD